MPGWIWGLILFSTVPEGLVIAGQSMVVEAVLQGLIQSQRGQQGASCLARSGVFFWVCPLSWGVAPPARVSASPPGSPISWGNDSG